MNIFAIIIAMIAALGFSGFSSAAKGYLDSCKNFDVKPLDGEYGRAVIMYAECRNLNFDFVRTNLDLNTCFSWVDCKLSYPGAYDLPPLPAVLQTQSVPAFEKVKDFSSTCEECDNPWQYDDQFGTRFACKGYCDQKDENGMQQSISDINLNEYIGNDNGNLHCSPNF